MAILEADLSREMLELLQDKYDGVFLEVPLYNRCIDAVLLRDRELTTIEFKIKDWRRAIRQIRTHLVAADYSYLCMPEKRIPEELSRLLSEIGIGLLLYNVESRNFTESIPPRPSIVQHPSIKEKVLKYLSFHGEAM